MQHVHPPAHLLAGRTIAPSDIIASSRYSAKIGITSRYTSSRTEGYHHIELYDASKGDTRFELIPHIRRAAHLFGLRRMGTG